MAALLCGRREQRDQSKHISHYLVIVIETRERAGRESRQFSLAVLIEPVGFLPHVFKYFAADNTVNRSAKA
jgi:hypothetical protein